MSAYDLLGSLRLADGAAWGEAATDWQLADAAAVCDSDGPSMHYLTRPRGGSKTTDGAALAVALHLTDAPDGATSYVVAADADQAALVLDSVRGLLLREPGFRSSLRVERNRVVFLADGELSSTLTVVPADEASAYGLRPWLLIADELSNWPETPNARGVWAAVISALPKMPASYCWRVPQFPALSGRQLFRILQRAPLSYSVARQSGSHTTLVSDAYPTLHLAFHDKQGIPPGLVKKILTKDVGLSTEDALALL